jgi:hypothetical protein
VLFTIYYFSDKITDEVGAKCSTNGNVRKLLKETLCKPQRRREFEILGEDDGIR